MKNVKSKGKEKDVLGFRNFVVMWACTYTVALRYSSEYVLFLMTSCYC